MINGEAGLPYAAFAAGRLMPPQSLNWRQSHRHLRSGLSDAERAATLLAVEKESLWTDETLARWIERDFDVIIHEEGPGYAPPGPTPLIDRYFDLKMRTKFRGWPVSIYVRKSSPTPDPRTDGTPSNGDRRAAACPFA